MAHYIKNANIWGRIGSGLGQGMAESIPKEIDRARLSSGLEELGQQKNLTPFQQFARLSSMPGITPQMVQSGSDLLRQQSIIDTHKNQAELAQNRQQQFQQQQQPQTINVNPSSGIPLSSATTTQSTRAALDPYIPPSGKEIEAMARQKMSEEPVIYPNMESARNAVQNEIAGNTQQSNAMLNKRALEQTVQNDAENALQTQIKALGAEIPGPALTRLQQEAVDDVATGKLTPEQAKVKYGKKADAISRDFSNIKSWGNLTLMTKSPKDLLSSIRATQKNAKEGKYQKDAADALIADNGLSPQMAYAQMYPVSEQKALNHIIKNLPDLKPKIEKVIGAGPGLAGIGLKGQNKADTIEQTKAIAPRLALGMSHDGSPLSIAYEIEHKGYDAQTWKDYLLENKDYLNLTSHQMDELQKPQPGFFGWLNDWWLKSFSGAK